MNFHSAVEPKSHVVKPSDAPSRPCHVDCIVDAHNEGRSSVEPVFVVIEVFKDPELLPTVPVPSEWVTSFDGFNSFKVSSASVSGPSPLPNARKGILAVTEQGIFAIPIELTPREIPPSEPPDGVAVRTPPLVPSLSAPTNNIYHAGVGTHPPQEPSVIQHKGVKEEKVPSFTIKGEFVPHVAINNFVLTSKFVSITWNNWVEIIQLLSCSSKWTLGGIDFLDVNFLLSYWLHNYGVSFDASYVPLSSNFDLLSLSDPVKVKICLLTFFLLLECVFFNMESKCFKGWDLALASYRVLPKFVLQDITGFMKSKFVFSSDVIYVKQALLMKEAKQLYKRFISENPMESLYLVDLIQRLGIKHHFAEEFAATIRKQHLILSSPPIDFVKSRELYEVALTFR